MTISIMKKISLSFLILLLFTFCSFGQDTSLTVMTYNIRFNNPDDGINAWPLRKQKVTDLISRQQPVVFGLQEALIGQIQDIQAALPDYSWVGVGRDDGKEAGEFSPVFYDKGRLKLLKTGTFWLSEQPTVPGLKGWDAACPRIVTWAKFDDKLTGRQFFYFNTHFDHIGFNARRNSCFLVMHAIDSLAGKTPAILGGDFNSAPRETVVQILTLRSKPSLHLKDSRSLTSNRTGPIYTFTGFDSEAAPGEMIDFIFVKNISKAAWHKVIDEHEGRYYPSDHLPVVVNLSY